MTNPGMGVMLGMLGGNEETVKAHLASVGKIIKSIDFNSERVIISFTDDTGIRVFDNGQSCCENRYMASDHETYEYYIGAKFTGCELRDAPNEPDTYGEHEVQFLLINTDKGTVTIANHNEHNGYYGGFWIVIEAVK